MGSGWRIVDCTTMRGAISTATGQIIVKPEGAPPVAFPVQSLAVVLIGVGTVFSAGVLHRLNSAGVAVLFCDWRRVPVGAAYQWSHHTRVGARNIAQASASIPRKKALWAEIIRSKVRGQAHVLKRQDSPKAGRLSALVKEVRSGDPTNVEAQAARVYWQNLFPTEPFLREPQTGVPPNGALDYGYSILRGHGIRAVLGSGLNPALGVFHRGRSNPFNLVDDIIEPFRPAIDDTVATLGYSADPSEPEVKQALVAAANQTFLNTGETIPTVLDRLAQNIGRYFEKDVDKVLVPQWSGPYVTRDQSDDAG